MNFIRSGKTNGTAADQMAAAAPFVADRGKGALLPDDHDLHGAPAGARLVKIDEIKISEFP